MLVVTTLIGAETALGFVFDPRYKDFPFAALTMAVVPFCDADAAQPAAGGRPPDRGSGVCRPAGDGGALYRCSTKAPDNWQSLWTCAMYFLLGAYAVAGAGRANPKISSPIASPDRPIL